MRTLCDNVFAGGGVLGRTIQTTLLKRASDAPFSSRQPLFSPAFHRIQQVINRLIHSFFQRIVVFSLMRVSEIPLLAIVEKHYYYCLFNIINKAVVVGGCEYVDNSYKAFPDKELVENTHVDNFVDSVNNLLKKLTVGFAQAAIMAAFFVPTHADAAEVLVNMAAVAHIESTNNPKAWNRGEDARGLYQLRKDVLTEWNAANPKDQHKQADLFDRAVNEKLARWYLSKRIPQMIRHFKKPVTERNVLIAYNAGIKYVKTGAKLPATTVNYLEKYARAA